MPCICQDQHRRGHCTEPGCPYAPPPPPAASEREAIAKIVYDGLPFSATLGNAQKPEWVPGGNSHMQTLSRSTADAILALPSPSGTEATTCCKGLAPSWECRCEQERIAATGQPYQRARTEALVKALEIARPWVERAYEKTSGDEQSAALLKAELDQIDAALSERRAAAMPASEC